MPFMLRRAAATVVFAVAITSPVEGFADDIVIIVNRDNTNVVDASFVQRVYVGTIKGWPDGTKVMVLDQPEGSEAREVFCATVLKKSVTNVKAIWSQNIFTGKALPPKITTPDLAIKQAVASNVGAIGYIHASQLDATVKVLGK
jgi:ABC-type phosphate transport system substrate-binding protein